jgi:hypothetical protein
METQTENTDYTPEIVEYVKTFDERELIALEVARQQLGDSLNLNESNGFKEFISSQKH